MFRDKSGIYTSFMRRLFLAVNCGGGGDRSGRNTNCVAGSTWQRPVLRAGFSASKCQAEHVCLLLLAAPHSHVRGASYPCVRINSRWLLASVCHADVGGVVHVWPLRSPAATEQTGNPNSQDPASQRLAVGLDAHSSSNYVV